ncbi:MAG: hypothetical protein ACRESF_00295, partial [Pseudomonas sp.]
MLLSLTSGYVLGGNLGRGSQPSKRLGQSYDQSLQTKRLLGSVGASKPEEGRPMNKTVRIGCASA